MASIAQEKCDLLTTSRKRPSLLSGSFTLNKPATSERSFGLSLFLLIGFFVALCGFGFRIEVLAMQDRTIPTKGALQITDFQHTLPNFCPAHSAGDSRPIPSAGILTLSFVCSVASEFFPLLPLGKFLV